MLKIKMTLYKTKFDLLKIVFKKTNLEFFNINSSKSSNSVNFNQKQITDSSEMLKNLNFRFDKFYFLKEFISKFNQK